ncbi:lectin BRA-3-like isoform X2 [Gigantopelta aegis]|uniref:lectin BRA-3-like isoform X2 n=1 Tax=Gigantopelta aegis TaxID=1735272 RepID=UPI001B88B9C8|nr:lectin BRA-3-like isoform X2 [Gigantopelta aegis]
MQCPSSRCMRLLAVFLCCISSTLSCELSYWVRNFVFDDVTINTHVISSASDVTTVFYCAMKCKETPFCGSISYNDDGTCRLYPVVFPNDATFPHSPGWRHFFSPTAGCILEQGYVWLNRINLCIKVLIEKEVLSDVRNSCSQLGARLVVLDTKEKNTDVGEYLKANVDEGMYFIGLTDVQQEGRFVWENGKDVGFSNWVRGEPNGGTRENCAVISSITYQWKDYPCRGCNFIS